MLKSVPQKGTLFYVVEIVLVWLSLGFLNSEILYTLDASQTSLWHKNK